MHATSERGRAASTRRARRLRATLVVALLLGVGAAGAGQEPSPAATRGIEAHRGEEAIDRFVGTYRALDVGAQQATIDEAIEQGTEPMPPMRRRIGRRRLHAVNEPVESVRILREGDRLITDYDGRRYGAPVSGAPERATDPDGEPVEVSYRMQGDRLRARYVGPDGTKVMEFVVGEDDERMTMHVTLTSDQLPEPIRYRLGFARR